MPQPIIYVNGWPGVGKLTVARELVDLIGPSRARLVNNHLLVDPAGAVLPHNSADYATLRKAIRSAVFSTLTTSADTFEHFYIFTDFQRTDDVGSAVTKDFVEAARARGCKLIPINLTCSLKENLMRAGNSDRSRDGKGRLTDLSILMDVRSMEQYGIAKFGLPEELDMDITDIEPKQAAQLIFEHIQKVLGPDAGL